MLLDRDAIQTPERAALARLCLPALALACFAIGFRGAGCACSAGVPHPPSLVWDGSTWAAAWGAPQDGAVDVYVHRFQLAAGVDTALTHATDPERAIRVDSLRSTPELAAGPDGFLLLVHRGDRDLVAVALDAGGRVRGQPRRAARATATLCSAPGWTGEHYAAAWVKREADGSRLMLAFLDRTGAITHSRGIAVPEGGSCALAVGDRSIALFYTAPRASALTIAGPAGSVDVDLEALAGPGARVLRLVARETGFAILLRQPDGPLRVAELDRRGRVDRHYDLPGQVDRDSADLGSNRGGLFVTWTDSRHAWLAGLSGDGALTHRWYARGGRELSGSRALGRARECATAWTSLGGLVVHAAVAPDCPRR